MMPSTTCPMVTPALSPTMETGILAEWYLEEGSEFSAGDALAKIETDVRTRTPYGMRVVALRISLLEGTEIDSVVDIGLAKVKIRPF